MIYIAVLLVLALLSYLGVSYFIRIAWKYQILDRPNERSSHFKPIPLGGVVIVLIVLATGALVAIEIDWKRGLIYIMSGSIMAWMGWHDDVHSLPAVFRLVVQGAAARRGRTAQIGCNATVSRCPAAAIPARGPSVMNARRDRCGTRT